MAHQPQSPAARAAGLSCKARAARLWQTGGTMSERDPFRGPGYGWPTATIDDTDATPAERALGALKIGAILAVALTIVLIYISASGGLKGGRDLISLLVVATFLLPSLIAWLLAWRARLRRRGADRARNPDPPAQP